VICQASSLPCFICQLRRNRLGRSSDLEGLLALQMSSRSGTEACLVNASFVFTLQRELILHRQPA
jgi:hypothetical protein